MKKTMFTVSEIADMFGVSKVSVRNWLKAGLPFKKEKVIGIKTRTIINPDDVKKFQTNHVRH